MAQLRAGVAGAGVFGAFHARKYASLEGVTLASIYDPDAARSAALAQEVSARAHTDLASFLEGLDVVTIAAPGRAHYDIALAAVNAGCAVYVEKPLTETLEQADKLLSAAASAGRIVACGHQERVTFAAMGLFGLPVKPLALESVRRGTPNTRNRDISCVLDLMIHDLDLALVLTGEEAVTVEAEGAFDAVVAEVTFSGGLTARFEASRIADARLRTMRAAYADGAVEIDFLAPSFRNTTPYGLNPDFAASPEGRDPLGVSVSRFLDAVRGAGQPVASGADGVRALDLALAVEMAAGL
jgi:predicted dehydrogenase